MELNLRPASVVRRHQLTEKRPFLVGAGVCALLALTAWWLYYEQAAAATNKATEALTPKVAELENFERRINAARAEIKAQQDGAMPLLRAVDDRNFWVKIIDDINSRLPKDFVWITSFDLKAAPRTAPAAPSRTRGAAPAGPTDSILALKGLYLFNDRQTQVVDDFVNKLSESPLYTVIREEKQGFRRSVPNDETWAYDFEIPLLLKPPGETPAASPAPNTK